MRILMVTAEAVPFAKTGGLADMVSALSIALAKLGHEVKIVLPRYYKIDRKKLTPLEGPLAINRLGGEDWTEIYSAELPGVKNLTYYFIDHERNYGRDGVYGTKSEPDFWDNPSRFSMLGHGAFQICRKLGWYPDIVHAHDWSASVANVLVKHVLRWQPEFSGTASVFTIHNLGYQGQYSKLAFPALCLDWGLYYGAGFEHNGGINFLQAGLTTADMITTVSPTYANEVCTYEGGFGLDGLLRVRRDVLRGILNGVDTDVWNPATDKLLPANYSSKDIAGKARCKAELQRRMGLEVSPDVPVIGIITRLADQKGIGDLFGPTYGSMWDICAQMRVQVAILGSGERWCEDEIRSLQSQLPNLRAVIGYDENLSHLIEAGSDFFLMPSKYEPCGLNQMYSLIYGTLPIVHRTGGLADTVQNYNEATGDGDGFLFDLMTPRAIFDTVGWAVYAWYNKKDHIARMRRFGMEQDFGWEKAARSYLEVYKEALFRGCGK